MTRYYSSKQALSIIEKSISALGLEHQMKTDPEIIRSVLQEMKLDDFKTKNRFMMKFLIQATTEPQSLQPVFDSISKGMIAQHPAIVEFAKLALEKNWFKPSKHVVRSVHVIYILEALTATMCNSHAFFMEVQDHQITKRLACGLNQKQLLISFVKAIGISHSLFETVKALSVDPAMVYFRIQRGLSQSPLRKNEAKKLLKNKKINYLEYKLLSPVRKGNLAHVLELVRINIYEAGITEYKRGSRTNAISAHELSEYIKTNPPLCVFRKKSVIPERTADGFYTSIAEKENRFPVFGLNQDWISLYITWNMAFILNVLDDLDVIFPNLLFPSIMNAHSEDFLGVRAISLWLSINHCVFRKCCNNKVAGPANKAEMADAWAKINKGYAINLAKRETHEDSQTLANSFNRFFSHPVYNLLRLVRTFY